MKHSVTSALIALFAALASPAAHASDSIYLGDCARARIVQKQSTIDTLIPHKRYEGMQRAQFASDKTASCEKNSLMTFTLTERSRNSNRVVFDMVRNDIYFGQQSGCPPVSVFSEPATGTVAFTVHWWPQGELCEVYVRAEWDYSEASKVPDFWSRVISMENGAFVIAQQASSGGLYSTPLAFSGVNP
jgi:hypothetical protein